jgi:putative RecB family exonuclease
MKTDSARQMHISHSQITEFTRCPRKYHLHYRLGLLAAFCPSGLLFGSAVHEAIACYHQARLEGRQSSAGELLEAFRGCWESERLPVRFKRGENPQSLLAMGQRILEFYLAHPHCAGEPLAVEEPFRLELSDGLPPVWGQIDLVETHPEGHLVLSDFKTAASRSEPDPAQLVLYREAVRRLDYPGAERSQARYVLLLKTIQPEVVVLEQQVGAGSMEKLGGLYASVWEDIRRGCSFPIPGWCCQDCQWQRHCDQGPGQTESRVR